ncbi:MAG: hypothetical protein JXA45_04265 [Methanomassiliicoccales archaeon]|nr:hypothetical protein [Methanomassiliicoccales archaeon]
MVVPVVNAGEFDWRYADVRKGVFSAVLHLLKYLVLPLALVLLVLTALDRGEGAQQLRDLVAEMQFLVLAFGLTLTVLGFFKGVYPKGSYSRLTMGTAIAVITILYIFSLLLGGRLQTAISREAFEVDLELLFVLYFVLAIFTVFLQLGEFVDHRRPWLEAGQKLVPREREDPRGHRWYHDFRARYGSLYKGLKLSRGALLGYVVIPMAMIIVVRAILEDFEAEAMGEMLSRLDTVAMFLLLLGLPITALSFFKGFYPKGSFSRLLPALAIVLLSIYWIWMLGMEGRFVLEAEEGFGLSLDYSALLLILIFGIALWGVYYVLELLLHRREWREGGFPKELPGKRVKFSRGTEAAPAGTPAAPEPSGTGPEGTSPKGTGAEVREASEEPEGSGAAPAEGGFPSEPDKERGR